MRSQVSRSIVFPGQGVQRPGMGEDFYRSFPVARKAYEEASDACGLDLAELCFSPDDERLHLTEFAQPAILCTEIAMWRALQVELGLEARHCLFAGHSLGEYSALVAAGALPLGSAAALVRERGRLMQQAAPPGGGAMLAVISENLDLSLIRLVIDDLEVDIANDNSTEQVVLSGTPDGLQATQDILTQQLSHASTPPWRFVPLAVSAPFHSRFMTPIEREFERHLSRRCDELLLDKATQVASNYSGGFHAKSFEAISHDLVNQISGTVHWRSNMQCLANAGAPIIEVGPSKPLRGFFRVMGIEISSVVNTRSIKRLSAQLADAA